MKKIENLELKVGESHEFGTVLSSTMVLYAGMPNEKSYSLGVDFVLGAVNLYFPLDTREIKLNKGKLEVLDVNSEKIILKYVR